MLSHFSLQVCFLCLPGHQVLPSMRSPRECFCFLTLVCEISLGYPSPLCSNSSPSFPAAAFAFLSPASLPPRDILLVQVGVPVLQCQKILLAAAAAPGAVSRIPISQAWRCLPFHSIPAVPAGLAACCVMSRFACWCLATSVRCCHLSVIPGFVWLCSCSACTEMLLPRAGDMCQGSPLTCVLAFCTSLGPWHAVVWLLP